MSLIHFAYFFLTLPYLTNFINCPLDFIIMKLLRTNCIFYILFLFTNLSFAQGVVSFTSDYGLSNTCIRSFYEDSRHNVWICTTNGLNRYDGAKISVYSQDAPEGYAMQSNYATDVVEIDPQTILIGLDAIGMQILDVKTNRLYRVPLLFESGDTIPAHISTLSRLQNGNIYAITAGYGAFELRKSNKKVNGVEQYHARYYSGFSKYGHLRYILNDSKTRIWLMANSSVILLNKNERLLQTIQVTGNPTRICESSSGRIYLSTEHEGLFVYDEAKKQFVRVESVSKDYFISNIKSDDQGHVYLCTDGNGLQVYDEETGETKPSSIKATDYNLAYSNVKDFFIDYFGNKWVGVYWKGVIVQPNNTSNFQYIGRRSAIRNTIGTNCVTALLSDELNNMLWVGTDNCGLYHINADGTEAEHFKSPQTSGTQNYIPTPGVPSTIIGIFKDSEGQLWLGGSQGGLSIMNPQTRQCRPFGSIVQGGEEVTHVYAIAEDKYKTVWICTNGDFVYAYNLLTKRLVHFHNNTDDPAINIIHNSYISGILIKDNKMYLATSDGMEVLTILGDSQLKWEKKILPRSNVSQIACDGNTIWAATNTGLAKVSSTDLSYQLFTTAEGLPTNRICGVEIDVNHQIWVSTLNGMACFNPTDNSVRVFRVGDGIQGNEFTSQAHASMNGNIYFGGINGITFFNPTEVNSDDEAEALELRFTGFYVNNRLVNVGEKSGHYTILENWIDSVKCADLCHDDRTFALEFSSMRIGWQLVTYYYKVNNGEWQQVPPGQRQIVFNSMQVGTYNIVVRAESFNQKSKERTFVVEIHPAWYASIWAKLVYLLILLAIAYFLYQQYREREKARKILARHKQEEELNEARMQFFMNISHEIRTPMTLITSPLEKLIKNDTDPARHRSYSIIYLNAQRILRLINQMMDVRKIEKGQFQLSYSKVDLVPFLQNLYDLFNATAQQRNITMKFLHEGIEKLPVCIDMQNFDKVIMNLLSNAVKFTSENGKITMQLETPDESHFTLQVTDNGVGIPLENRQRVFDRFYSNTHNNGYVGTGIGLNLTKMLVELHGGTISINDNPEEQGTQFTIQMPRALDKIQGAEAIDAETQAIADVVKPSENVEDIQEGKATEIASTQDVMSNQELPQRIVLDADLPVENAETKPSSRLKHILIVEDDAQIRQYVHSELSSDFIVSECSNGKDGWDFVQQNSKKVDLIVSDVMMPKMDGVQLCRMVKNNFLTNHIPVILLTAKSDDADRIEGLSIGVDAYITKPFNMEVLRSTITNLLHSRHVLQGKFKTEQKTEEQIDDVEVLSADEHLMERVMKVVNENISNPELNIEFIADKVGVSRVHFHRKIKDLTGQTPGNFLRSIRMTQAAKLLASKHLDITDVSIATGFKSISTFSTSFKQVYGMTPSEYMKRHEEDK